MRGKSNYEKNLIIIFLASLIYAIARYNIFINVSWVDLPLYVTNKALSISALFYFSFGFILRKFNKRDLVKLLNNWATLLVIVHCIISLIILSPDYFSKLFFEYKLNLIGQISLLFGVIAFGIMFFLIYSLNILREKIGESQKETLSKLFLISVAVHVTVMGYSGWLTPETWPRGMPPITLISFGIALLPFFIKSKLKNN